MNVFDIVFQQQKEKDVFLGKDYVRRDGIEKARKSLNTGMIKVISGPRRSGKSVFGFQLLKGQRFFYLNFDDENLLKVKNYDEFIDANNEIYKNNKNIFFDEIQNLEHWEIFVNKLHRRGYNLVLTGSNSRLLSGELASNLTGRYLTYTVLPFSFNEFLKAKKEANIREYFQTGGFPEVVVNNIDAHSYLQTLFQSVLLKDIVKRYNLGNVEVKPQHLPLRVALRPVAEVDVKLKLSILTLMAMVMAIQIILPQLARHQMVMFQTTPIAMILTKIFTKIVRLKHRQQQPVQ